MWLWEDTWINDKRGPQNPPWPYSGSSQKHRAPALRLKGKLNKQQLTVKSLHVAKTAGLRALIWAGQSRHWRLRRRSPHLCPALEEQRPEDLESHDLPVQLNPLAPGPVRDPSHRIKWRATDQCTVCAQPPVHRYLLKQPPHPQTHKPCSLLMAWIKTCFQIQHRSVYFIFISMGENLHC